MVTKHQKFLILFVIFFVSMSLLIQDSYTAPTVTIVVNPEVTEVGVGTSPISLVVPNAGPNVIYKWELDGPGKLEGDPEGSAIFYWPPDKIDGKSTKVIITVTVTDSKGEETPESKTFTIKSKGMSVLTKTAIGVGAAAALGGAIILATGGDDNDAPSITILFPEYGSQIDRIVDVSGVAKGCKTGDYVSILTYSYGDNELYLQTNTGIPDGNGNWTVASCYFGREGDIDIGVNFSIQAELRDSAGQIKVRDTVIVTRK